MSDEWSASGLVLMIPIVAIIGGITSAIVATVMRARVRELEIRERIAMIEKGLVPPPEVDPRGFEHALARSERVQWTSQAGRHRRAGITLLGVGFGLMMLIGVAGGSPEGGIGVGGFLVILGIAFFVNSLFELRQEPPQPRSASSIPPASSSSRSDQP
jgi:hypothetical protein